MSPDQRCGHCLYWEGPVGDASGELHPCVKIVHRTDMKPADPAYVMDSDDYSGTLNTRADFGCVLYALFEGVSEESVREMMSS